MSYRRLACWLTNTGAFLSWHVLLLLSMWNNKSGCWLQPRTHIRIITPSLCFTRLSLKSPSFSRTLLISSVRRPRISPLAPCPGGRGGRYEREGGARAKGTSREMPAVAQVPCAGSWHTRLFASLGARDTTRMGRGAVAVAPKVRVRAGRGRMHT